VPSSVKNRVIFLAGKNKKIGVIMINTQEENFGWVPFHAKKMMELLSPE
jgi:hypothetical protein